ncbi:DUF934 domain-containing protein [Marinobacter sp. SS13-12]|jgi:uncharacterized protein (DUF934 family)|uniref:DUF934 domain-containing protein n=1 Tax=Marinobacter sp. SS13-12 TaxID=3050451 RepID=UPI0025572DBB|nr:DUF934 domain-containing protein [Marinobacter sp. SS13-12]MDK8465891.1 DUF934 domain-containing protein [Marinobacter sp. SS13-12]
MINLIGLIDGQATLIDDDPWEIVENCKHLSGSQTKLHRILPLAAWLENPQRSKTADCQQVQTAVLLDPEDNPEVLAEWIETLPLIALQFHSFRDGRAYSQAFLLRERMGFSGDLRAVGEVLRDQLAAMRQCGFTSFAVRQDKSAKDALKGLAGFDMIYARSIATPEPHFRRRGGE